MNIFQMYFMERDIKISPYHNMLVYKQGYTPSFVKKVIDKRKLEGLRVFDVFDRLESLDFLKDYGFLKRLDITCANDQDYSFLQNLTNLKHLAIALSVEENNIIDLSNQHNLETLAIQWRKGKILGIEKCQNLTSLCLMGFKEKDFNSISQLKGVVDLNIKTASIETTNGLQNLNHLTSLQLGYCPRLKSIKDISGLKRLSSLEIEACSKIEDYDELKELDNLIRLKIGNGKGIKSIDFIKNFSALEELSLSGNTNVLDGDMTPVKNVKKVFHKHRKHYNLKIENEEYEKLIKSNLEKIKGL